MVVISFKNTTPLPQRISECNRILAKYPAHVPVIVDIDSSLGKINKTKFLVPYDVSASHLICSIRKQIKFNKNDAMMIFCDNIILCPTLIIGKFYEDYLEKKKQEKKFDNDKFLYLTVVNENTFGN